MDFSQLTDLYNTASVIGWPMIFIIGQLRGFVYVRPHVEMILERVRDLTIEVKEANGRADRALTVAEGANQIALQTLAVSEQTQKEIREQSDLIRQIKVDEVIAAQSELIRQIQLDLARLSGRAQGGQ